MSAFMTAVESLIDDIKGGQAWVDELNDHSQKIGSLYSTATAREIDDALGRFASLFPAVPLVALGHVAITCGSLVEQGGDPEIAGPALLERLPRVNETATDFYLRCRALAESEPEVIEELRADLAEHADDEVDVNSLPAAAIIDEHVANYGWHYLAQRFGTALFEDDPASVLGHMAEEFFRFGLIAHLSRSRSLRRAARAQSQLLEQTLRADEAAGSQPSFLVIMLQVLDDEPLLVVHVEQRKGFEIRIAGIADNFQLNTLLAGAIIGPPGEGMLTGEAPSPRAVAQCRDLAVEDDDGEHVIGAFNLWNWSGLQADGRLPDDQMASSEHWIWNEGSPADIAPFEGRRVVLLAPPPYERGWQAGRAFHGMVGELSVERQLSEPEVADWLNRLARAANP